MLDANEGAWSLMLSRPGRACLEDLVALVALPAALPDEHL